MTVFTDGLRPAPPVRYIEDMPAPLSEGLGDTLSSSILGGSRELAGMAELGAANSNTIAMPDDFGGMNVISQNKDADLPADQVQQRIKDEGLQDTLKPETIGSVTAPALDIMVNRARDAREMATTQARGPQGIIPDALHVGTSLGAGLLDPVNLGLAYIPGVGEARYARMLAAAGDSIAARTAVRAAAGGVHGAAGMAAFQPLEYFAKTQEGQDYTLNDFTRSILLGFGLGASAHNIFGAPGVQGAIGDMVKGLPPRAIEDVARIGINDLASDRPVRAAQALDIGAQTDPQISEALQAGNADPTRGDVHQDVFDKLKAVGMSDEAATDSASVMAAQYASLAERYYPDKTAADLYREDNLDITRGAQRPEGAEAPDTDVIDRANSWRIDLNSGDMHESTGEVYNQLKLAPTPQDPNYPGFHRYRINDEHGAPVAEVDIDAKNPKHLFVNWIGHVHEETNVFGPSEIRSLIPQIKQQYPEAQTIGGHRVSGARHRASVDSVERVAKETFGKPWDGLTEEQQIQVADSVSKMPDNFARLNLRPRGVAESEVQRQGESYNQLRLARNQGELPGRANRSFSIEDEEGKSKGTIEINARDPKHLYGDIWSTDEKPNVLGTKEMRSLLPEIAKEYPDAETIWGYRVSGARRAAGDESAPKVAWRLKPKQRTGPVQSFNQLKAPADHMLVYHGTAAEPFKHFELNKASNAYERAVWFATHAEHGSSFAGGEADENARVIPALLPKNAEHVVDKEGFARLTLHGGDPVRNAISEAASKGKGFVTFDMGDGDPTHAVFRPDIIKSAITGESLGGSRAASRDARNELRTKRREIAKTAPGYEALSPRAKQLIPEILEQIEWGRAQGMREALDAMVSERYKGETFLEANPTDGPNVEALKPVMDFVDRKVGVTEPRAPEFFSGNMRMTPSQKEQLGTTQRSNRTAESHLDDIQNALAELKSQTFNQAPTFFSAVSHAVDQSKQDKASPDQWLGMIKNSSGVKPEEMEWLGLNDWLKDQKGSVTKQALKDYIRANAIEVREVYKTRDDSDLPAGTSTGEPKFSQWQLPGAENYRELLLTLPSRAMPYEDQLELNRLRQIPWQEITQPDRTRLHALEAELGFSVTNFRSSHWPDVVNPLAHIRFNDRTIDGKKTLFLEEIQSDWHQKGKKEGYKTAQKESERQALGDEKQRLYQTIDDATARHEALGTSPEEFEKSPEIVQAYGRIKEINDRIFNIVGTIPDAPFKTTWPELTLKRMIRYAAENGYEKLAWTPGEVQADRYDLSKQITKLEIGRNEPGHASGEYVGVMTDNRGNEHPLGRLSEKELADQVGKDLAAKIVEQPVGSVKVYKGLDLKVGGEGMRGFYDQILPAAANKLVKKFGAKVKDETYRRLPTEDEQPAFLRKTVPDTAHVIDITPELREAAIEKGFPLFQGRRGGEDDPRGRITLNDNRALIELFKTADRSTFVHESSHLWLAGLVRRAREANAPEALQSELGTVLRWMGVDKAEDITTVEHERFAQAFERYLAEGQAPSSALGQAFDKFKSWLLQIYRSLSNIGAPLSDDVKGIFDRMLASDREIEQAKAAREGRSANDRWQAMANEGAYQDPEIVAASNEANALPDPASIDPKRALSDAQKAAAEAEEQWKASLPYLSEDEQKRFGAVLDQLNYENRSRLDMLKMGADCLAMAAADSSPHFAARAAIAAGAPRAAVAERLVAAGHDVAGL